MLMLRAQVLREKFLILMNLLQNFLCDLETALRFSVGNAVFLYFCFGLFNVVPEHFEALVFVALGYHKIRLQSFALMLCLEDKFFQFGHHFVVSNLGSGPAVHNFVALAVEVAIVEGEGLLPVAARLLLGVLLVEKRNDSFLVKGVRFLADEGGLQLVELLLEVLLVLAGEQLADRLQLALAAGNAVNLNALDEHLNEGRRLGELGPGEGQRVEADAELLFAETADHHFEQANAQAVHVLKHEHLHLLALSNRLLVLREGPVVGLALHGQLHARAGREISYLEFQVIAVVVDQHF